MNRQKYIIAAAALVVALAAAVLVSCTKEKNTENQSGNGEATEEVVRKPIATKDLKTGEMTYNFDLSEIQQKMSEALTTKTNQDRFVVESVQIEDNNPSDESINPAIRITILDTDEEVSYTMWYMENFVDKVVNGDKTNYYEESEVRLGTYEFAYRIGDTYYRANVNGNEITTSEIDSTLCMGMLRWFFVCLQQGCGESCEKGGTFWNAYCLPCTTSTGQCNQAIAPWIVPTISIIGSIIIAVL